MPTIVNTLHELELIKEYSSGIRARAGLSHEHWEIHQGKHHFVKGITSLNGAGATGIFGFLTPPEASGFEVHARALINGEEQFDLEIWEGATLTGTGAAVPSFDNNRLTDNPPLLQAFANPVVNGAASGTSIWKARTFSGKSAAGVAPALGYEIITKYDTVYLWKITKIAAGTHYLDYDFFWYEEDNGH